MATGPTCSPTNKDDDDDGVLTYLGEILSGAATLLQEAPVAVASEAAGLMQEVPVVGIICKTFLSFKELADTAESNKDELLVLRDLCEVVMKKVLERRSDRSGLFEGACGARQAHQKKGEKLAKRCNGAGVKDKMKGKR